MTLNSLLFVAPPNLLLRALRSTIPTARLDEHLYPVTLEKTFCESSECFNQLDDMNL